MTAARLSLMSLNTACPKPAKQWHRASFDVPNNGIALASRNGAAEFVGQLLRPQSSGNDWGCRRELCGVFS